MRLSSSQWSVSTHDLDGWFFLRRQLAVARATWVDGEAPPLPLLAREFASLAAQSESRGRLPVPPKGSGGVAFRSLRVDAEFALARAGGQLREVCADEFRDLAAALLPSAPSQDDWRRALDAGERLHARLGDPQALSAALGDLLDVASSVEDDQAFGRFSDRLDTFRGTAECQDRAWADTRRRMGAALTQRHIGEDGHNEGGTYDPGTSAETLIDALHEQVLRQSPTRDWAVWVATLAGPADRGHEFPTVVEGPIAVCGIRCSGETAGWLSRVQTAMRSAFVQGGFDVPRDVEALFEPARIQGHVVQETPELWRPAGDPASFLSRVSVRARTSTEARERAFSALRAVFGRHNVRVASDLRADPWLWTDDAGWSRGHSARDAAKGEVFAVRDAAHAVDTWAADLGPTLDDDKLKLLEARALINNEAVSPEVRLARAVSCLEALPAQHGWSSAAQNLWLRWAWEMTKRRLLDQLWNVALSLEHKSPPAPGRTYDDIRQRHDELLAAAERGELRIRTELMSSIAHALEPVHRESYAWAWQNALQRHLEDGSALSRMRSGHRAACKRAQRHRNLIVHGWSLDKAILLPTVEFTALQLEIAIVAEASRREHTSNRFGSMHDTPPSGWERRTPGDLVNA